MGCPNCEVGDDACLEHQKMAKPTLNISGLANSIKRLVEELKQVNQLLEKHNVPHVDVSYKSSTVSETLLLNGGGCFYSLAWDRL